MLEQLHAGAGGLVRREIAAEGEISHQQRAAGAPRSRLAVMDHLIDCDLGRVLVAEHHHTERVSDKDDVGARLVGETGAEIVVGGEHADRLATLVNGLQLTQANLLDGSTSLGSSRLCGGCGKLLGGRDRLFESCGSGRPADDRGGNRALWLRRCVLVSGCWRATLSSWR